MEPFEYIKPKSLTEACEFIQSHASEARIYQGGTDLLVRMQARQWKPKYLVDVKHLPELRGIHVNESGLVIGAAETMNDVAAHSAVRKNYPLLVEAIETIAAYPIRNRATIGGNICNAAPSADLAPALLVTKADCHLMETSETRCVPIDEFFIAPGKTAMISGEILTKIHVPQLPKGAVGKYLKLGRRAAMDLAIVGVAVLGYPKSKKASGYKFRVALASVAPTPIRVSEAEDILGESVSEEAINQAAAAARRAAKPISDVRASEEYRAEMVEVYTRRGIEAVLKALA